MKSPLRRLPVAAVIALIAAGATALAVDPPSIINHQGRITVGGVNYAGPTGYFKFVLVDSAGTTRYWDNDGTTGGAPAEPGTAVPVAVSAGHYGVGIGDTSLTNMAALDPDIFADNSDVSLRIYFSTMMGGPYELLTPDIVMNSVGFALNARKAQMVPDGAIGTAALAEGAVTVNKIAGDAGYFDAMVAEENLDLADILGLSVGFSATFDAPFQTTPTLDVTLDGPGSANVSNLTATGFDLDVTGLSFAAHEVDPGRDARSPSMALVNGLPAVAYYDETSAGAMELRYAYSSDAYGIAGTWTVVTVDTFASGTISSGMRPSLAVVAGKPAIAYHDPEFTSLRYAYSSDAQGTGGTWTHLDVESGANNLGFFADLENVSGGPAIAYIDSTSEELRYARSTDAQGTTGWSTRLVRASDPSGDVGLFADLEVVNGVPAIAYYDADTEDDLEYSYATTATGMTGAWMHVSVDTAGNVGAHVSFEVVNGFPAIAYIDITNTDTKFAYSSDVQGAAGTWSSIVVHSASTIFLDLELLDGKPFICGRSGSSLRLFYSDDADGDMSGDWSSLTALSLSSSANVTSFLESSVGPLIAYVDGGAITPRLKVASIELPDVKWTATNGNTLPVTVARSVSVADGSVGAAALAADSVSGAAIADGSVAISDIAFDHGDLMGLDDDDHSHYALVDGTRAFTGTVGGIAPVAASDLATKGYVDGAVGGGMTDHGLLTGLTDDDHPQYLRSDASDVFTGSTLTFDSFSSLRLDGAVIIGNDSGSDDDVIQFDAASESLKWDESETAFVFSNALIVEGPINAGDDLSPLTAGYNYFSTSDPSPSSGFLGGGGDVYIDEELEVNGQIFADGDIRVGTDDGTDDDSIYFDTGTVEYLRWENTVARFALSSGLLVDGEITSNGDIHVGGSVNNDDDQVFFDANAESITWDESDTRFEISDALAVSLIHAGAGASGFAPVGYNFIANGAPVPGSGDISNSIDLYISGDLEVAQTIYGTVMPISDRSAKENFEPVNSGDILQKVAAMPITTWQYKGRRDEGEKIARHIGPVAQDFHAAFGVGVDDRHISTTDADGVALAAIQALKAESDAKSRRIEELEARLEKLEKALERVAE